MQHPVVERIQVQLLICAISISAPGVRGNIKGAGSLEQKLSYMKLSRIRHGVHIRGMARHSYAKSLKKAPYC